jgi:ornithine carbamoyltransferase
MYEGDFFLTWEKTDDELEAVWTVADALRYMRENNISTKVFESGLGISLFRDNSTRTRFSFASAWKFRIWTKASLRLPMARLYVKQLT